MNRDRCTGHCCEVFKLPFSPDGLRVAVKSTEEGRKGYKDIEVIEDMVIPLGKVMNMSGEGQDFWNYACRHFDSEKKLCKIYEKRPDMCRKYGEEHPCDTSGCTFTRAKRDPELIK
ncbi:hypothetical protein LCGC14_1215730 [marine sediment metagenome]|uniref:Zinc/iron-chelating domain-containing protein n=1 Tax=marine sediment metagenome TaxID=412755 RepID=A0A0F9PHA1_9ZZZZ